MSETVISCEKVWKIYGPRAEAYLDSLLSRSSLPDFQQIQHDGYIAAVRDVSLSINRGEILVIMGLSGSGKSTLVRCFSRLVEVTGGNVTIEGRDISTLDDKELIDLRRRKMGMVFQNFGLLPHRTVLENVAFPLEMRKQDVHTRRARALDMIKLVGLEGREEYFPRELSGGQQQRVGIARSLAIEPDIWFLDEPFSALDPLIRREMQDEFLRLQSILGKTIIFITHDFDEALRLADRIAIMKDGAIEQVDRPDQIALNPQTDYVAKFIRDVDKARVIHVGTIMDTPAPSANNTPPPRGQSVLASDTIHHIARRLIEDDSPYLPVCNGNGTSVGVLERQRALDILLSA